MPEHLEVIVEWTLLTPAHERCDAEYCVYAFVHPEISHH